MNRVTPCPGGPNQLGVDVEVHLVAPTLNLVGQLLGRTEPTLDTGRDNDVPHVATFAGWMSLLRLPRNVWLPMWLGEPQRPIHTLLPMSRHRLQNR